MVPKLEGQPTETKGSDRLYEDVVGLVGRIQEPGVAQQVLSVLQKSECVLGTDKLAEILESISNAAGQNGQSRALGLLSACQQQIRLLLAVVPQRGQPVASLANCDLRNADRFAQVLSAILDIDNEVPIETILTIGHMLTKGFDNWRQLDGPVKVVLDASALQLARGEYSTAQALHEMAIPVDQFLGELLIEMRRLSRIHVNGSSGMVSVETKDSVVPAYGGEVVTAIDLAISLALLDAASPRFPSARTEEHEARFKQLSPASLMVFDPLDGTEEFTKGLVGRFGIQGAVLEQSDGVYVPTKSVILMPGDYLTVDEISVLASGPGRGVVVEKNGVKFSPPLQQDNEEIRVHLRGVTMDRWREGHEGASHIPELLIALSEFGTSLNRKVVQVEGGPSAHGAARMAMQEVDLVIWLPPGVPLPLGGDAPKDHDVAPLHAVACALGGWACDLEGKPIRYEESRNALSNGFIASTTLAKEQVIPVTLKLLAQLRGSSDN